MLVSVISNRFGHLEIDPVSQRARRDVLRAHPDPHPAVVAGEDALVYLQGDGEVQEFLDDLPRGPREWISRGYLVHVRVNDEWVYAAAGAQY